LQKICQNCLMSKARLSVKTLWWLYVIETEKGSLYTGITTNLERRWRQHTGEIKGGAKFFNSDKALAIRYKRSFKNRSSASIEEARIKKLTKKEKIGLIKKG
jgi:putative endonuclease